MTDYNHNMGGVDLKDQLLHTNMIQRKKMTKWYLILFKRLLKSTVLNLCVIYRRVTGKNIQQLSYRIQLVEGLFTKYACAAETRSVPGRQASDNSSTAGWKIFSENSGTQNWEIKTSEGVFCVLRARKNENFSVLLPNPWWGPLLGR
jgi:hypothetical protein